MILKHVTNMIFPSRKRSFILNTLTIRIVPAFIIGTSTGILCTDPSSIIAFSFKFMLFLMISVPAAPLTVNWWRIANRRNVDGRHSYYCSNKERENAGFHFDCTRLERIVGCGIQQWYPELCPRSSSILAVSFCCCLPCLPQHNCYTSNNTTN